MARHKDFHGKKDPVNPYDTDVNHSTFVPGADACTTQAK